MHHPTRPRTPVLLVLLVLALLVSACAGAEEAADDGGTEPAADRPATEDLSAEDMVREDVTEPADDPTAPAPELALPATGTLGLAEIEGGCTFLEVDGERYELIAASGSDLAVDPANGVIATAGGEVLAEVGDTITVDGVLDPGVVTFCQLGPVIALESVTPA